MNLYFPTSEYMIVWILLYAPGVLGDDEIVLQIWADALEIYSIVQGQSIVKSDI